jgi:hypothetical protein
MNATSTEILRRAFSREEGAVVFGGDKTPKVKFLFQETPLDQCDLTVIL